MDLEKILADFEPFNRMQSNPLLSDDLLLAYIASVAIDDSDQISLIRSSLGKKDLSSISVIFHEKMEMQWYLNNGFSPDDIRSGKAHKEKYNEAHGFAYEQTLELYQFVSEKVFGTRLPKTIVYITQPHMQDFSLSWLLSLHDHPDQLRVEDVENGIALFERFGSAYTDRTAMLQKCEQFIRDCKGKYYTKICDFFDQHGIK